MKTPREILKETGKCPPLGHDDLIGYIKNKDEDSLRFFLKHYSHNFHEYNLISKACLTNQAWLEGIGILAEEIKNFSFPNISFYQFEYDSKKIAQPILNILFDEKNSIHKKLKKNSYAYTYYKKDFLSNFLTHNDWCLEPEFYVPMIEKVKEDFTHNHKLISCILNMVTDSQKFEKTPLDFFIKMAEHEIISPFTLLQTTMQETGEKHQQLQEQLKQVIKTTNPIYLIAAQIEAMQFKSFPDAYLQLINNAHLDKHLETHHHHLISTITFLMCNQPSPLDFKNREINNDDYMDKLSDAFFYAGITQRDDEVEMGTISTFEFFNQVRKFNENYHVNDDINAILDPKKLNEFIENMVGIQKNIKPQIQNKSGSFRF